MRWHSPFLKRAIAWCLLGCFYLGIWSMWTVSAYAYRMEEPSPFSEWDCPSFGRLNHYLHEFWNITNGRYNLDTLTASPDGTRQGTRGELVYAAYGGDEYICVNSSTANQGTTWTCINLTTFGSICGSTSNTQVLFNDNGSCGGDNGFLYGKTVDHASLGPDAAIDKAFTPTNFSEWYGASNPKMLTLSDVQSTWTDVLLDGIAVEMKANPSGVEGFDSAILDGISSHFIVDGTAGATASTKWLVDSLVGTHFGALTNVTGTGSIDSVDALQTTSFDSELYINLSGIGTNDVETLTLNTVSDIVNITADRTDVHTLQGYERDITYTVPQILDVISNLPFSSAFTANATTSMDAILTKGYESIVDLTTPNQTDDWTSYHFYVDADYTASSNTAGGDDIVNDFGLYYDVLIDGNTTMDQVVNYVIASTQTIDVDELDDGPSAVPNWDIHGWNAVQTIGANSDSGTVDSLRGIDLTQTWSGDIAGTSADGIRMTCVSKAGSGTLATGTCLNLIAPSRSAGTLTNAYTIQLTVPTTGGTENAGIRFADGLSNLIEFEGNTANGFETRLSVAEPTADNTQTFQDLTGSVALTASAVNAADFIVDFPAAQTIAAGNTIAANACGSLKLITAAGAVTTDTTNTFTAPAAANKGCIMHVCNTGANNITLDNNANFKSAGAADVVMTADDCVTVGSTGASGVWYQITALEAN